MNVVYIAGPYRAATPYQIQRNIDAARAVALDWWRLGWAAICPHSNTYHMDGEAPDSVWLEGDMEILRRCDAVALVDGWERSSGTLAERELAYELGIPVYPPGTFAEMEVSR